MVLLVRSAPPGRAGRVPGGCPGFCAPHGTLNTAPAGAEAVICRWMFYSSWVSKPAPVSTWTLAKPAALTCWAAFSHPKVRPSPERASAAMMTLSPPPAPPPLRPPHPPRRGRPPRPLPPPPARRGPLGLLRTVHRREYRRLYPGIGQGPALRLPCRSGAVFPYCHKINRLNYLRKNAPRRG